MRGRGAKGWGGGNKHTHNTIIPGGAGLSSNEILYFGIISIVYLIFVTLTTRDSDTFLNYICMNFTPFLSQPFHPTLKRKGGGVVGNGWDGMCW